MAMTLVSTVTVGSGGAASIEFTNIPQTGKDLLVLMSTRGQGDLKIRFNGSATAPSRRSLFGSGSSVGSVSFTDGYVGRSPSTGFTANTFSNNALYITNYTSSTAKTYSVDSVDENNATEAYQTIIAGIWDVSSAITSFVLSDLNPANNPFVQHSTVSLYIIS